MNNGVTQHGASRVGFVYEVLAEVLAAGILSGHFRAGGRLAGERTLAAQYGVAVGTVRRAVRELRERGLVVTMAAKGTYVTSGGRDIPGLPAGR